jgi:ribosomal protein S18 acetylase RimI-like enzyme
MKQAITLRPGTPTDLPFLWEMLFEAAYWRPDQAHPTLENGLARPDLDYLLADWGREGDTAVIAILDGQPIGAAWYRFWGAEKHSYGYVSPTMPELGIAVRAEYRRRGIGSQLLASLLEAAKSQDLIGVSLSVEMDNPAANLYLQHDFAIIAEGNNAWTMVIKF